jgi:Transposase IS116/IS110/IS902 family
MASALLPINLVAAATLVSVTGDLRRFRTPMQLSFYFGLVPSDHLVGDKIPASGFGLPDRLTPYRTELTRIRDLKGVYKPALCRPLNQRPFSEPLQTDARTPPPLG